MDLCTKLVLITLNNPGDATLGGVNVGRAANADKHLAADHDENEVDGTDGPGPAVGQKRQDVGGDDAGANEGDCDGDDETPWERLAVGNGNGGVLGDVFNKFGNIETTRCETS